MNDNRALSKKKWIKFGEKIQPFFRKYVLGLNLFDMSTLLRFIWFQEPHPHLYVWCPGLGPAPAQGEETEGDQSEAGDRLDTRNT